MKSSYNIALVHDWLTGMRGGEKCLEVLCELFPNATLFTLLHNKSSVSPTIEHMHIQTSFVQHLPFAKTKYRNYLPLFPAAVEEFNLKNYDLVISTSHCVAKGAIPRADAVHICYCHTPMRYVWDLYEQYLGQDHVGWLRRTVAPLFANYLRTWDVASSNRVDYFIANSENVRRRIQRHYHRDAEVIYPPVDTSFFQLSDHSDGYYLIVSALVPYKRVDLAIAVFNQSGETLVIVGTGPDEKRLKRLARSNIEFVGWCEAAELVRYYQNCRALIFPGEEDFGIVPLEAMACGKPVIAYKKGGVLETVLTKGKNKTGIFFEQQTPEHLHQALKEFQKTKFNASLIRKHALRFDCAVFRKKIKAFIEKKFKNISHSNKILEEQ